jgi:hypothetical protein
VVKRGLVGLVTLVAVLAVAAGSAVAAPRYNYQGNFMRPDGKVRCWLGPQRAQCVSMESGRVVLLYADGRTDTYLTQDPIYAGTVPRRRLVNRTRTILCSAGSRYVTCLRPDPVGPEFDSGFAIDTQGALVRSLGVDDFQDDTPAQAPVPYGYVPPSGAPTGYANPYRSYIPDYSDPGGTYGTISDVTGLPRIYPVSGYTRQDGTYVAPYYRSCSRC